MNASATYTPATGCSSKADRDNHTTPGDIYTAIDNVRQMVAAPT